jgi:hypothetical protein
MNNKVQVFLKKKYTHVVKIIQFYLFESIRVQLMNYSMKTTSIM